jgi:hypothetical protein
LKILEERVLRKYLAAGKDSNVGVEVVTRRETK